MAEIFGATLRRLRQKNNLTQGQLALRLGKAESTIRMWELGKNHPDYEALGILAQIFGVSLDYLLGREESPVQPPDQGQLNVMAALLQQRPALGELLELAQDCGEEDLARLIQVARAFRRPPL